MGRVSLLSPASERLTGPVLTGFSTFSKPAIIFRLGRTSRLHVSIKRAGTSTI
jgi:hypothetical protein